MIDFSSLTEYMGNLQEEEILAIVREIELSAPKQAIDALEAMAKGMTIVGERFDNYEYFVGDLIFAGEIFTEAMELLRSAFPAEFDGNGIGKKVVLATVEGDLHDIGKNIVKAVLQSKGLEVIDLGVNVAPHTVVAKAIEENADIIALSAVLTSAIDSMQRTVEAFEAAGIRDRVKIIVGGACVNAELAKKIRADYYGKMPKDTAEFCLSL